MRSFILPFTAAALALAPQLGSAAPRSSDESARPALVIQVQAPGERYEGWWEREHREDEMRERYWRLPPEERARYNRIEIEVRQLQRREGEEARERDRPEYREIAERIERLRHEQMEILRF